MNDSTNKTILDAEGNILFFGLKHFIHDIANGDCCFICGASPQSKEFNDEHVIPDWILKRFNLHSKNITLPNGTYTSYSQYKVPCCRDCNSELGKHYEEPISKLLNKSYREISQEINKDSSIIQFLFVWLNLIYLKTHLKDKSFRFERDYRKESKAIGEYHFWEDIHHIHCMARSHYTGAYIEANAFGSVFVLPAITTENLEEFDYVDNSLGKAILIRLSDFAIVAVLNDGCAGSSFFAENLEIISGPLSPYQLREIVAHLSFININLKERPVFHSNFNSGGNYIIGAIVPEYFELAEDEDQIVTRGKLMRIYAEDMMGDIENKEQILKEIAEGRRVFLFDEKGDFSDQSKCIIGNKIRN